MDPVSEIIFLRAIERRKEFLGCKRMDKESRNAKKRAWNEVREEVRIETGKNFDEGQAIKKWQNLQTRVIEKLKDGSKPLNEGDQLCLRILGQDNPKLVQIKKEFCNWDKINNNATELVIPSMTFDSEMVENHQPKTVKRKKDPDVMKCIDELKREVLILQKEELRLSIKKLKRDVEPNTHNKATQT